MSISYDFQGMVASGGGYYYDSVTSGGWCKTITAANVEAVRKAVTTAGSWNVGFGATTNTYLPRTTGRGAPSTYTSLGSGTCVDGAGLSIFEGGYSWIGSTSTTSECRAKCDADAKCLGYCFRFLFASVHIIV